jgi:hypothetical protein
VIVAAPYTPFHQAVIFVAPTARPVTVPSPPTAATAGSDVVHATLDGVVFCPLSSRAERKSWSLVPLEMVAVVGATINWAVGSGGPIRPEVELHPDNAVTSERTRAEVER